METCFNVIYRDLRITTHFSTTARWRLKDAQKVARKLNALGWDVIIDPAQPLAHAPINAPIIDVHETMKQCKSHGIELKI